MDPIVLSAGTLLVAFLLGKRRRKRRPSAPECEPFPWLSADVDDAIEAGIQAEICDGGELAAHVADVVYPVDMNDRKIEWPKSPPWSLPHSEPDSVRCLWERIKIRVDAKLAVELDNRCPPPGPRDPADVIGHWIAQTPEPGRFYRIQSNDNLTSVARRLLQFMTGSASSFSGHPLVPEMMRAISGPWNSLYFGTIPAVRDKTCGDFVSEKKPAPYWAVETPDGIREITQAFCPKHEDAIKAMFAGHLPNRTINEYGEVVVGGPKTWGVLWIPGMDVEERNGDLVLLSGGTWSDGSTMGAPPPEVLEVLS